MASAPGITWWKYSLDTSGTSVSSAQITSNTVDYDAVQAGSYSNIMCVRPQFSSDAQTIGKVRFWWYGIKGTNGSEYNLPNNGWVMKYYVTNCTTIVGSSTASTDNLNTNLVKAINAFANATVKSSCTTGKTFTPPTFSSNQAYYKSVWKSDDVYYSMQPIPFFTSGFGTSSVQSTTFSDATHYNSSDWITTVFGSGVTDTNGSALQVAVGGDLNSTYSCNLASSVASNNDFPFIFMSVRPPSNADAGSWSGFSCRLSYIWPYTVS